MTAHVGRGGRLQGNLDKLTHLTREVDVPTASPNIVDSTADLAGWELAQGTLVVEGGHLVFDQLHAFLGDLNLLCIGKSLL